MLPPNVVAPGTPIATITPSASATTKLPSKSVVCAGTTDSIAAFIAAGVDQVGQSVTSLGSTLAVKLLSDTRVDNAAYGVYSHRLGEGDIRHLGRVNLHARWEVAHFLIILQSATILPYSI